MQPRPSRSSLLLWADRWHVWWQTANISPPSFHSKWGSVAWLAPRNFSLLQLTLNKAQLIYEICMDLFRLPNKTVCGTLITASFPFILCSYIPRGKWVHFTPSRWFVELEHYSKNCLSWNTNPMSQAYESHTRSHICLFRNGKLIVGTGAQYIWDRVSRGQQTTTE